MDNPSLRFKREDGTEYPEWKSLRLGERFTFKNGINASREAFRAEGVHCIGVSDVYKCLPIIAENVIGTVAVSDDETEKNKVNYGDVLFQRSSETKEDIGHAAVYYDDTPSVYNGFVICAKPDELFYEPLYLHYSLQHTRVRKQTITLGAGSGQHYNIGQEGLAQINVVFPCLEEQQRISDLVFSIDEIIAQSETEVQNLEQQKKAAMQKIFSQEVRFKREDGSEYPEWKVDSLKNLCDYTDYRGKTPTKTDSGIFLITAKNIKQGYIDYETSKEYIAESDYDNVMHRGLPQLGDVLITTEAPCGNIAQIDKENVALAQRVIKYRGKKDILSNDYLCFALQSDFFQDELDKKATGGTVKGIKGSVLHTLSIIAPCLEEQQKIADFLSAYDEAIGYAKQELEHWKQLKKGLLQQMFV